jgi:hypothetical protein
VLVGAAGAYGAATGVRYAGRTSQGRPISFQRTGAAITHLQFHIVDRCPGGKQLFVHDSGFPALQVKNSKFGGTFVARAPEKATAIVSGRVQGQTVSGTLSDRTRNSAGKFCTGRATFKLTHSSE